MPPYEGSAAEYLDHFIVNNVGLIPQWLAAGTEVDFAAAKRRALDGLQSGIDRGASMYDRVTVEDLCSFSQLVRDADLSDPKAVRKICEEYDRRRK